jgi:tousled-like kinase
VLPEEPNNRKITDYMPRQRAKAEKAEAKEQLRQEKLDRFCKRATLSTAELQKLLQEKEQTEISLREKLVASQSLAEDNALLRERLRQKDDQLAAFKGQIRSRLLDTMLENHRLKRNELRGKLATNKIRLGEYVTCREAGKTQELWVDGSEIRQVREKLDAINNQKEELEKHKKNIKPRKGEDDLDAEANERRNSILCQVMMLSKEEAHLKELFSRLEEEKVLHMKEYKMVYEEDQ